MNPDARLAELLAQVECIRAQRDRYRDALVRIICARSIADARKIISQTFKEERQCQNRPPSPSVPSA
jgi:hypothetical protein